MPTSLPEWIVSGWGAIGADPALDRALGAWHQGVLLSPSFPSYALIAFVGAIEAAAKSGIITRAKGEADVVSSGERNDTSQSSEKTGSAQTFWSAVSLVAHPDAVKRLRDDYKLYGRRSSTAHGGRLHGTETTPGAVFLFPVDRNRNDAERSERGESGAQSAQDFELQQLAEARGCATRLMLGAFTGNYDKGDW